MAEAVTDIDTPASRESRPGEQIKARRLLLEGHVQGVGFRPFVARLARAHDLSGWVKNCVGHVEVLVCGPVSQLDSFRRRLVADAPPLARPRVVDCTAEAPPDGPGFDIVASDPGTDSEVYVPADSYLCDDCRRELENPADRRYGYPFINCTQCGPRYTLIEAMPYDRPNTSMAAFELCAACRREYGDEHDRRFHAEPIACPDCGPQLALALPGEKVVSGDAALDAAVELLHMGKVVAAKGIGGYHLLCNAADADAVALLRQRKQRPHKPLAVMVPVAGEDGLDWARRIAIISNEEALSLLSAVRPVTLVSARQPAALPENIAPGLGEYGLFVPYSPLHQVLLARFGGPVVATSGNISGEPVITCARDAEARLTTVADAFLHHDRPIVRPADDPVVRQIAGRVRPMRLGRGNAPLELDLPFDQAQPMIALGGQTKVTVTLSWGRRAVVSPHIGDMESPCSLDVLRQVAEDLQRLYGIRAERIACDAHPGYTTHRWACSGQPLPVSDVSHHHAHAGALVAEAAAPGPWIVFTWDGVGLGEDGTLWGGEALVGAPAHWQRFASLRPFRLPGGERAGREPWRSAAGALWACHRALPRDFEGVEMAKHAHDRRINSPWTSAAGRLFDAAAALVMRQKCVSFEGAAPMMLEALCREKAAAEPLPLSRDDAGVWRSDWAPVLGMLCDERLSQPERAERFHAAMAGIIRDQALRARRIHGTLRVGLCGGVFQNRVLAASAIRLLEAEGFDVFIPERLPCNDAAISLGQAVEVAARSSQTPC